MSKRLLEVCIDSVASAIAAEKGGADRVELCDNLVEGGTTPSYGMIKMVRSKIGIGLQVMIRPRGGDFLYSGEEIEVMKQDIESAKTLGADGVVFGLLLADGSIDKVRTKELIDLARPMNVTFHRAFDMVQDYDKSLQDLIELGVERILTSGLHADVISGQDVIKKLVSESEGKLIILAGGGVRTNNVEDFVDYTNVPEVHASGRKVVESQMEYRNEQVPMGAIPNTEYITKVADENMIREFKTLIN